MPCRVACGALRPLLCRIAVNARSPRRFIDFYVALAAVLFSQLFQVHARRNPISAISYRPPPFCSPQNLNPDVTPQLLVDLFEEFGEIFQVRTAAESADQQSLRFPRSACVRPASAVQAGCEQNNTMRRCLMA